MSRSLVKTPTPRGPNAAVANPERLDGQVRYATSRNVKMQKGDRRYDVVRLWRLKERTADGIVERGQTLSRAEAEAWVSDGVLP